MKKIFFGLVWLFLLHGICYAQEGAAVPTGTAAIEAPVIESILKGEMAVPQVEGLDLNAQVEKGQEQLLEQMKQSEQLDNIQDKIQQQSDMNSDADEDDEKIVNIRSSDFLREISLSTKGYYGYDLFYTSRGFKLESSLTAYSDYQVGPGDEIVISMWGDVELRNPLRVSNEGTIYVNNVGLVSVNGLKLDELEAKLRKLLAKAYITLSPSAGGEPSTYLDVSMGKLRPITVFLVGEVFKQGAIKLDSYSSVFTALYNAGGPTAKGSMRNIQVIRNGKVISTIDIYDYLLTGKKVGDIILKNDDNILVPPRYSTIKLEGEVNNISIYELKENETMADLIKFSGGIKITANLSRFQVERIIPFENRTDLIMHSKEVKEFKLGSTVDGKAVIERVKLYDGDIVTVFPISNILINYVNIEGAVILPGKYALEKNMTLKDLLKQTGGLLPEAFLKKAHLTRTQPDLETRLYDLNLSDPNSLEMKLESSDFIKVYSVWELVTKNEVSISGHVKKTGRIFLDDNAKVSDLIQKAGGLEDDMFRKNTYLERADLIRYNDDGITTKIIPVNLGKVLAGDKAEDLVLQNKDHLKIYDINITVYPKEVTIQGMVRKPGKFNLQSNMRVEDLILQAGGFEKGAYNYEAEVFRVDPYNIKPDALVSVHKIKINQDYFKVNSVSPEQQNALILQDMDMVVIRQYPDYQLQRNVVIKGEVKFPGAYSLIKEKETLADLIERAGGLKNEAFPQGIQFSRDSLKILSDFENVRHGSRGGDMTLKNGDVITVPKHPGVVRVEGFVFTPGLVKYQSNWSLSDYVAAAGGVMVDDNYERGETVVFYPGGAAKVDGWFSSPSVKEGSTVVVKKVKKPEVKEGMTLQEWVTLIASVVSISYYFSNMK